MICLEVPPREKMKRIQRRQYVRTDAVLDVQIQPGNEEEIRTLSYNISAGGIAVVLNDATFFSIGGIIAPDHPSS